MAERRIDTESILRLHGIVLSYFRIRRKDQDPRMEPPWSEFTRSFIVVEIRGNYQLHNRLHASFETVGDGTVRR